LSELRIIDQLVQIRRTDLGAIHQEIVQFILGHVSIEDVSIFDEAVRLRYYKYFFKRGDINEVVTRGIFEDSNFLIRVLVLKEASRFSVSFQKSIISLAIRDTATLVKIKALDQARHFLPDLVGEVRLLLLDKAYSVRELSRTLLKSTGMHFVDYYRQNLESGTSVAGSVMGLCDVGDIRYLEVYKKY